MGTLKNIPLLSGVEEHDDFYYKKQIPIYIPSSSFDNNKNPHQSNDCSQNGEEQQQEYYSWFRFIVLYIFYMIFFISMMYASGIPFLICSFLQQCGKLPDLGENPMFWNYMFPISHDKFHNPDDTDPNSVDM